jgi:hypothetical protein
LDAIDNSAPVVAATVSTSTPPRGGATVQCPQPKPGEDGRVATRSSTPSSSAPRGRPGAAAGPPPHPPRRRPSLPGPGAPRPGPGRGPAAPPSQTQRERDQRHQIGAGRSGARSIDSRVDRGRLSRRLTGPSASLPSERRSATLAARTSWGVSTSCHQQPAGRSTARRGRVWARRVTAPARVWSPSLAGPRPAPPPPAAASTAADRAGPRPPEGKARRADQLVAPVPQPCANSHVATW